MQVVPEEDPKPNVAEITEHLRHLTRRWPELDEPCLLEIVHLSAEDKAQVKQVAHYAPDDMGISLAADDIAAFNALKINAYATVNPVSATNRPKAGRRASAEHIIASFFHFADADTAEAAENIRNFVGPKATFQVITGTQPCVRPHVYWELEEPTRNLAAWSQIQGAIADKLKTDRVTDPPRIMRLGGTVNWPKPQKAAKGYVAEITRFKIHHDRPPVSSERMARAFANTAQGATQGAPHIDLGPQPLDREKARIKALKGEEWRNNVKSLVASSVARGMSDWEILAICKDLTIDGYTTADTEADVRPLIEWAREQEGKNGGKYAQDPQAEAPQNDAAKSMEPFDTTPLTHDCLTGIAPRAWLYGSKLLRGFCSVLVSPGGTGKSAWAAAMAADMAGFQNYLHDMPHRRLKVWIYNLEDPRDETLRKFAAIRKARGLSSDDLSNIIITSGRDRSLIVAEEIERGVYMASPDVDLLIEAIKSAGIDVLVVDPAVRCHRLPENDNKAIDLMMDQFARIAHEANCAILLIHHTRKGFVAGEMDSMRGASSMASAARIAMTLQTMTQDEAIDMNIPEAERRMFIRMDNAKSNLAPPSAAAEWLKLESHNIDNATEDYPDGDFVQVISKWQPPNPWDDVGNVMPEIIDRIHRGYVYEDGFAEPYSPAKRANDKWVANAVLASFPNGEKSDKQAMAVIRHWLDVGIVEIRKYKNRKGDQRDGIYVVNTGDTGNG